MKRHIQVLQIAFTYVGTVVGAGFASGQEILQFFTRYGAVATGTSLLSTILFIGVGIKLMLLSREVRAKSYEDMIRYLFGAKAGKWVALFSLLVLLGVSIVMLAGGGAVFEEQLGIDSKVGALIIIMLTYFILTKGIRGIMTVNTIVVPCMILFSLLVVATTWGTPGSGNWLRITTDFSPVYSWLSPFLYTSFNLATAQAVLVPLGAQVQDRKVLIRGGILGGCMIGVLIMGAHYAMSAQMPDISQFDIPMGSILDHVGGIWQMLFLFIIYAEIFTTFLSNAYGLSLQIQQHSRLGFRVILLMVLTICFLLSHIGFKTLLTWLYPLFGFISLIWFILMLRKKDPVHHT